MCHNDVMREKAIKITKYYNVLFPIWMLIWLPSPLWLILIPANYLIDSFVLRCSLPKEMDCKSFCKKHGTKICIAGFVADLIGSIILFAAMLLAGENYELANGLNMNPFKDLLTFSIVAFAVFVSALMIYFLDLRILTKAGLETSQARRSALYLAIFTAPYLFFFPSKYLYRY